MTSGGSQLDYAPGAPVRRRRRIWRTLTVLTVLVAAGAAWHYGPGIVLRARQIYWQRQCMNFEAPPDMVVYERLPAGSTMPSVEQPYVDWNSPEVVAARPRMAAMKVNLGGWVPPVLFQKGPTCLLRLAQTKTDVSIEEGAILFCHERISPMGNRRLIVITLPSEGGTDFIIGDLLASEMRPRAYTKIPWLGPLTFPERFTCPSGYSGRALPPPTRNFAGQPDASDPSHFSIEYEWPDGVRGFVDGWLQDDDTFKLQIRPGPGDVEAAFKRGLHRQ